MIFEIYNVSFKQKKDFFFALGYSGVIADSQIKKQYGCFDNLLVKRLGTDNKKDIAARLKKLKDDYYNTLELNKDKMPIIRIKKPVYLLYKSAFDSLSDQSKELLINAIASMNNLSIDDIKKELQKK